MTKRAFSSASLVLEGPYTEPEAMQNRTGQPSSMTANCELGCDLMKTETHTSDTLPSNTMLSTGGSSINPYCLITWPAYFHWPFGLCDAEEQGNKFTNLPKFLALELPWHLITPSWVKETSRA